MGESMRCPHCNRQFSVREAEESPAEQPDVPLPKGMVLSHDGGGFTIKWRWISVHHIFMVFFCMFWDGFLVFWYSIALFGSTAGGRTMMLLFPLLHVGVGIGLTYSTLAGLINRTRLEVRSGKITVRHGPVPWRGNVDISTGRIDQLYVQRGKRMRRRGGGVFKVSAMLDDRSEIVLLRGLDTLAQAIFVEKRLEQRLGIDDRPIAGELGRR